MIGHHVERIRARQRWDKLEGADLPRGRRAHRKRALPAPRVPWPPNPRRHVYVPPTGEIALGLMGRIVKQL